MKKLTSLQTFVRCAEAGGISRAARDLAISPQAASQHIARLESWLGVELFKRSTRKVALTEEGALFYRRCKESLDNIDAGVRQLRLSGAGVAGTVRVAVTPAALGPALLAPLLAPFLRRYPDIALDIVGQNETPDLVGQGIDVWLFAGPEERKTPGARRVTALPLFLCAAPDYLRRHGVPQSLDELQRHRWVGVRSSLNLPHAFRFRRGTRVATPHVPMAVVANDGGTALRAVIDGVGLGHFPWFRIARDVRLGRLEVLDLGHVPEDLGLYVHVSQRSGTPRRSRVLADFLHEQLSRHADLAPPR